MTSVYHFDPPTTEQIQQAVTAWNKGRLHLAIRRKAVLWRTLTAPDAPTAVAYAEACYPSPTSCRLSPITKGGSIVPIAYAANTRVVSLWEAILRNIAHQSIKLVPSSDTQNKYTIKVETTRPLRLIDVRSPKKYILNTGTARAPDISSAWQAYYPITQQWAQALHDNLLGADGIYYESFQHPGRCMLIWNRLSGNPFKATAKAVSIADPPIRQQLIKMTAAIGVGIDFGDDPIA